ncbi:MAG: hypothetical protein DMG74_08795 [Acidobacteria bacterium]|nr:MAG: hypothetical protein DMG75_02710 [Acidobacteriota bacterium]PYX65393.1 MAG: hypothetical protein DMG74_08795 [Acidobacteriota bacterium]
MSSLNFNTVSAGTLTSLPLVNTCAVPPAAAPATAPITAPFPPPAIAPSKVPKAAPPPTISAVRLFFPMP